MLNFVKPSRLVLAALSLFPFFSAAQDAPPPPTAARILLVPRKLVSGERATLAVLDVNGRLTPGVTVVFSNGDKLKTDTTGRALFVAPLNTSQIYASIEGRPGRVEGAVLPPTEVPSGSQEVSLAPRVASLSDRFELSGHGFCGDADGNKVVIGGSPGLVLAASPAYLSVLPPQQIEPGAKVVEVSCGARSSKAFSIVFVALDLEANGAPLAPGEHRKLTVRVKGSTAKVVLEARNLAPEIATLEGGAPTARSASSGGAENTAVFSVTGKQKGNFVISIRLVTPASAPHF